MLTYCFILATPEVPRSLCLGSLDVWGDPPYPKTAPLARKCGSRYYIIIAVFLIRIISDFY